MLLLEWQSVFDVTVIIIKTQVQIYICSYYSYIYILDIFKFIISKIISLLHYFLNIKIINLFKFTTLIKVNQSLIYLAHKAIIDGASVLVILDFIYVSLMLLKISFKHFIIE